jgi:hypothetical protein
MSRAHRAVTFLMCAMVFSISIIVNELPGYAQGTSAAGINVSASQNTITVNTGHWQCHPVDFARSVRKPNSIPPGSRILVSCP